MSNNQETHDMTDALDILNRVNADDEAIYNAGQLDRAARNLARSYRVNGRLPWPAATDVREVHNMLGEIVVGLDEKKDKAA